MNLIIILQLYILIIETRAREVLYGHRLGFLTFNSGIKKQQAQLLHLQSPFVLHSLVNVQVPSYFGYWSSWEIIQGIPDDKLVMSVEIKGVSTYKISIQYFLLEQMPNMEVGIINLTWTKPQKIFTSHKGLIFNEDTQLTTHLIGFSNSNFTNQNFFFAMKGKNTYTIYTGINITTQNWVAMNLIIIEPNYNQDDTICYGSHINQMTAMKTSNDLISLNNVPLLPFFVGIEAIYHGDCDFTLNIDDNNIKINSGQYSFSVISINTTCIRVSNKQPELTQRAHLYIITMVIFISLSFSLIIIWLLHCLYIKYWKHNRQQQQQNSLQQEDQPNTQQQNTKSFKVENQMAQLSYNKSESSVIFVVYQQDSEVQIRDIL